MAHKVKAKRKKKKGVVGRPSRYLKRFDEVAYQLCLMGATDDQIAGIIGVSDTTIDTWKKRHPTFLASLKRGKDSADAEIAHALFHRARGYVHPETKVFCSEGDIITHDILKVYPPDTTACIFWLKNRQKKLWRDKHEILTGPSEELLTMLDIVNGSTRGKLPDRSELEGSEESGQ